MGDFLILSLSGKFPFYLATSIQTPQGYDFSSSGVCIYVCDDHVCICVHARVCVCVLFQCKDLIQVFYVDEAEGVLLVYLPNVTNGNVISLGECGSC